MSGTSKMTSGQIAMGATFVGIVALCLGATVYAVFPVAHNQGYAPEQPIPFSHKLHAGERKIDCKYCHVGVTKGPHATVPAMNVCMNCHSVVKTDSPHIQKLKKHFDEGKPIEWVRIHEMPDFVFFNHKPHIDKGVSCSTCHGDVARMERVVQDKTLHMGFCINCHRGETAPKAVLRRVYPDAENPEGPVAPTDCYTCHY